MSLHAWVRSTSRTRRRFLRDSAMASGALLAAACGASNEVVVTEYITPGQSSSSKAPAATSSGPVASSGSVSASSTASAVRVIAEPAFGSKDVGPVTPFTVTVFNAKITALTMTGADGSQVQGAVDASGSAWNLTQRLKYGQSYTIAGTATDAAGAVTPITGDLTTVNPLTTVPVTFVQDEGGTFGVAQPVIIIFEGKVSNKAATQRLLKLTTDKGDIEGSWGWLQDEDIEANGIIKSQIHWRPKDYWPANTKVSVQANMYGVDYGNGNWGRADVSVNFTIGRNQVTIADVNSFRLRVLKDGVEFKNYPVSYGKADNGRETRSGTHIVQAKKPEWDMCNEAFNYCGVKVKWAVRINNNGEFIHENNSTIPQQGRANVSHGCVNMSEANAKDYYDNAYLGDPVEVSGTGSPMSAQDYVYDWAYSYDTWKTFSAL